MDQLYAQIDTYNKRKSKLQTVLNKMSNKLPDDVEDANAEIEKTAQYLLDGTSGFSEIETAADTIRGSKVSCVSLDSLLSEAREEINLEISRCDSVIAAAEAEIARLEAEAEAAEAAEKAAAEAKNA